MGSPTGPSTCVLLLVILGSCSWGGHALQQDTSGSRHAMQEAARAQLRPTSPTYCMPDVPLGGGDALIEEMANIWAVLQLLGYEETEDPLQATLLWYLDFPFRMRIPLLGMKPAKLLRRLRQDPAPAHLVVNSHPGITAITRKQELAALSATLPFLPRTFQLPAEYDAWQAFMDSEEGAGMQWMQKGLKHRGVQFLPDPRSPEHAYARMLVQQRITPFLVHKRLWDLGLYVSITSVEPLVAYMHTGVVVMRLTTQAYDASLTPEQHTNVIRSGKGGHLSLGTLEETKALFPGMPGASLPLSHCFSLLQGCGVNTTALFLDAQSHIVQLLASTNDKMREAEKEFPATRTNGFIWARADFILAEDHKLYLMEANMSPQIGTFGDSEEAQLFRKAIAHDVLTLNGLNPGGLHHPNASASLQRLVADPVLLDVEEPACAGTCRDDCTSSPRCVLCHACRDERQNRILQRLQAEASGAHHFRRVYPPPQHLATYMQRQGIHGGSPDLESRPDNVLVATWLQAKCGLEPRFC